MKRGLMLALLLTAALTCYYFGQTREAVVLVGLGMALELAFWFKLLRKSPETRAP